MSTEIKVDCFADTHFHLRNGNEVVAGLINAAIQGGVDVLGCMLNIGDGITTAKGALAYWNMAKGLVPSSAIMHFVLMPLVTENTDSKEIDAFIDAGITHGKFLPFGRTTNSQAGIKNFGKIIPIVKYCGEVGIMCHFHFEHPSTQFSNRDAEHACLAIAYMLLEETDAVIVWEHGTDARCIGHWKELAKTGRFVLTLTAHHLIASEDMTFGDVRAVCKPAIKTEHDRRALLALVAEDNSWVMAGSDCAFHPQQKKITGQEKCASGAFTPFALCLYAHALDDLLQSQKGVDAFVNFTSKNARRYFRLPRSSRTINLARRSWQIPLSFSVGQEIGLPFWGGQTINWRILPSQ